MPPLDLTPKVGGGFAKTRPIRPTCPYSLFIFRKENWVNVVAVEQPVVETLQSLDSDSLGKTGRCKRRC